VTSHLTEPCNICDGSGKVPRARRRLPNGEPDRLDTIDWPEVICDTCNGSGQVAIQPGSIQERAPIL
jgi:RecJ-like exonuclease